MASSTFYLYVGLAALVAYYVLPYLTSWRRRAIPGPFPAALTNFWLFYQSRRGRRYLAVEAAHQRYGKFVRLQPNHVSIADVDAIQAIYGHGNGFVKSEYYDAFASTAHRSIFNTRDRGEHSRKRRAVAHLFSARSIGQFEQYVCANIEILVNQWSKICQQQGTEAESNYAYFNPLPWFNYLSFDIIGDLAFGASFGMLSRSVDMTEARKTYDAASSVVLAIDVLNRQGEVNATMGCYPQFKPFSRYIPDPYFRYGVEAVDNMTGIAIERVKRRLDPDVVAKNTRVDMLAKLTDNKDGTDEKLGLDELITESLTFLVAGSNSSAITLFTLLYWVTTTPGVMDRLHKDIDAAVPAGVSIPSFDMVKTVPFLQWVIWETLRLHSAFSLGLPRQVPPDSGPVDICGRTFYPGDVLSVPTYTLHHSKEIWGPDAEAFDPDRWDPARITANQKAAFLPFSIGPRACIGRNLAEMELDCIVAAVFRNFDFRQEKEEPMRFKEGFVRKPYGIVMGVRKRSI